MRAAGVACGADGRNGVGAWRDGDFGRRVVRGAHRRRVAAAARRRPVGVCHTDRTDRRVRAARERTEGRVHRVGAVGGVPRGLRVPAASVLSGLGDHRVDCAATAVLSVSMLPPIFG